MLNDHRCVDFLKRMIGTMPSTVLVTGSGFSKYIQLQQVEDEIPYAEIPGFPVPTNEAHPGKLIIGTVNHHRILIMQGRIHYYEGRDMREIVLPIQVLSRLGVRNIILTNASGGMSLEYPPGTLVLVKDHISSLVPNPLRGMNDDKLGVRFPDSGDIYTKKVRDAILRRCSEKGIALKEGVYIQTPGPSFETPAEIRAYRILGADLVGMSTACEAIAAAHAGMKVCCLSCVTNYASGVTEAKLTADDIDETIQKVDLMIQKVLLEIINYFAGE